MVGAARTLRPRLNIAPTTTVNALGLDTEGRRELVPMRWGLILIWWEKGAKDVPATFNARGETVGEKSVFRSAFRHRRCIIPASGFCEWTDAKGEKLPHLFTAADGSPVLAFAGPWECWTDPSGEEVLSRTIVVSGASAWMEPYYDRMPVPLAAENFDTWLSGEAGSDALRPAAEGGLREWIVSARVNRTGAGDDDPATAERAA